MVSYTEQTILEISWNFPRYKKNHQESWNVPVSTIKIRNTPIEHKILEKYRTHKGLMFLCEKNKVDLIIKASYVLFIRYFNRANISISFFVQYQKKNEKIYEGCKISSLI